VESIDRQMVEKRKKTKDKRQKTKDKRQKTKDKRQKTKDKRQKTKDKKLITEIWHTDEIHRKKPPPVEDALVGLLVFEQMLWNAMSGFLCEVDDDLQELFDTKLSLRNPYVDPLNILQVELLRRIRNASHVEKEAPILQDALKVTINGIAQGMRNTG
jgi:phosphoenolpyruvate carboxylase